eukprot:TRINITY_DN100_c2_g5_i1.p1 TRINITY_DN100_c2_g5~~TRINITY_DN100_c2_g5_i1.p1  ORF type:complete len:170 (-),score=18.62 TRINITY_DN100_c2_g5_i1:172-681(-)
MVNQEYKVNKELKFDRKDIREGLIHAHFYENKKEIRKKLKALDKNMTANYKPLLSLNDIREIIEPLNYNLKMRVLTRAKTPFFLRSFLELIYEKDPPPSFLRNDTYKVKFIEVAKNFFYDPLPIVKLASEYIECAEETKLIYKDKGKIDLQKRMIKSIDNQPEFMTFIV